MDMFMDKLAQKLTAQEIIKANTAADAEEMNKLKNQIAEYNDCLAKLQELIQEGAARLQNSQANSADVKRLVEEGIGKIQAIRQDSAGLEELGKRLEELEKGIGGFGKDLGELEKSVGELGKGFGEQEKALGELREGFENLEKSVQEQSGAVGAAVGENVHKECVKVYRNVQAVVVEESEKQQKQTEDTGRTVSSMGGKISAVLGISVAALVFSLASVILQLLSALNIKLF